MIVRPLCLAALTALVAAACQDGAGDRAAAAEPSGRAALAPTPPADGYVGVWAVQSALCEEGAWRFTPVKLSTAGEVSCDIAKVTQGAASWSLDVACTAEGPQTPGRLTLSLVDPAVLDVMTVQGGPFAGPVTLTRCNV
jgi:hypothetical protein